SPAGSGDRVSDFIAGTITDVDPAAVAGIAISAAPATAGEGTWQYSLDGTNWTDFGTPTPGNARLLRPTDRVRFVPAAGFAGTVTLTDAAWDQTPGTAGGTADLTAGTGGTTAFSTATDTASLVVALPLTPVKEDTKSPGGDPVSKLTTGRVTDP